jgi:RNA polymerase sigma-70 factor (ECF subfamily)
MPRIDIEINSNQEDGGWQREFLRGLRDSANALYGCILSLVPNRADADEVFQETVSVLWSEFQAQGPPDCFSAWSNSIARNIARSYIRRERRRGRVFLSEAQLSQITKIQAGSSELLELRQEMLRHCLEHLSANDRELLLRCYGSGDSIRAYARENGQAFEGVYSRLKRLRHRLFECVNRRMSGRE